MGSGLRGWVRSLLMVLGVAMVIAAGPIVAAALQGHFDSHEFTQCRTSDDGQDR